MNISRVGKRRFEDENEYIYIVLKKKVMEKQPVKVGTYVDNALFVLLQVYELMCLCEIRETL